MRAYGMEETLAPPSTGEASQAVAPDRSRYTLCGPVARPTTRDGADGAGVQSLWAGQEGQNARATLAGGLLLWWLGQTLARGGGDLYGAVGVHHGPIGGGGLARVWSVGASDAPADAAAVLGGHAADGVPLCGH